MIGRADQLDWFSPPELGRRYGFAPETIRSWIIANKLLAANTAAPGKRPRWRVRLDDFEAFLLRRSNIATEKPPRVRQPRKDPRIIEFY